MEKLTAVSAEAVRHVMRAASKETIGNRSSGKSGAAFSWMER